MHGGVGRGLHLLEYFYSGLMIWPELKHVAKVEGRLLEMPIRFQDLTELKLMLVLNYCCLLGKPSFKKTTFFVTNVKPPFHPKNTF